MIDHENIFFLDFLAAKLSIIESKLSFKAILFSMDNIATPDNLFCVIVFLNYVFISFGFENDLSALAEVTEIVKMIRRAIEILAK
jgi:hypothetical protein